MSGQNVTIKVGSDVKEATAGINKVAKQINSLANTIKKSSPVATLGNIGSAVIGLGTAFKAVTGAVKAAAACVSDLSETYKVQARAETQLETAAKNNPYLNSTSVTSLKNYASQLQSISTYGDEQLLPMMAELAAAGRNEEQIMDIMTASIDVAASGTMSLDSAVKALNGTYQGNVGALGKQINGVKSLTQEQLKNGDAVKLVAEQYKGMAEETSKAIGSTEQLKNAWGDFKEHLGDGLETALAPLRRGITGIITDINNAISRAKEARRLARIDEEVGSGNAGADLDAAALKKSADRLEEKYQERVKEQKQVAAQLMEDEKLTADQIKDLIQKAGENSDAEGATFLQSQFMAQVRLTKEALDKAITARQSARSRESEERRGKAMADAAARQAEMESEIAAANAAIEKVRRTIELDREAGKTVSSGEEAQRMYDGILSAYRSMLESDTDYRELENQEGAKAIFALLEEWKEKLPESKSTDKSEKTDWVKEAQKMLAEAEKKLAGDQSLGVEYSEQERLRVIYDALFKGLSGILGNTDLIDRQTLTSRDGSVNELLDKFRQAGGRLAAAEARASADEMNRQLSQMLSEAYGETEIPLSKQLEKQKEEILSFASRTAEEMGKVYGESSEQQLQVRNDAVAAMVELDHRITEAEKAESRERLENALSEWQEKAGIVQDFTDRSAQLINYLADLSIKAADAEKANRMADLEEQYEQGIISESEYADKQKQINRETAQEKYKAELWQWGSNMAQMAVSGAQAVLSALSTQPIWAGIAMAGLVGAMTAAQIGVAMANKPKAPSFEHGGIVPGRSWTGDKVQANVNSGEMILTRSQQADLWKRLQGGQSGWGEVAVNNYIGERASIKTRREQNALTIEVLDAHINSTMAGGGYDAGFAGHENSRQGVRII